MKRKIAMKSNRRTKSAVDDRGIIVESDGIWHSQTADGRGEADGGLIDDYIVRLCNSVAEGSEEGALCIIEGIRSVLRGEKTEFSFKYSKQTFKGETSVTGHARRIATSNGTKVLVVHDPVRVRLREEPPGN
jgi:hypothetical protein